MYSIDQPWSSISRFSYYLLFTRILCHSRDSNFSFLSSRIFNIRAFERACIIENVNPEEIDNYEMDKNIKFR